MFFLKIVGFCRPAGRAARSATSLFQLQMQAAPIAITHGQMVFTRASTNYIVSVELDGDGLELKGGRISASPPGDGCYFTDHRWCPDGTVTAPSFSGDAESMSFGIRCWLWVPAG